MRVWFLPLGDGWVRAKDHPDAMLEEARADRRDTGCPAGTIWKREIELMLPAGTPLLSRVTTPLVESLSPLDYMTKERRGMRRHIDETWFIVQGNYRLKKATEPPSFSHARAAHRDGGTPR